MIEDVVIKYPKQFQDERGKVMHMLKATDDMFEKFGEIYFSVCNPGFVKAWKMHKKKVSIYCVISGNTKLVLYDMRDGSETKNQFFEIEAGENNYIIIKMPPGVAHGFKCLSDKSAIIANLTSEPYDPSDNFDIDYRTGQINYEW